MSTPAPLESLAGARPHDLATATAYLDAHVGHGVGRGLERIGWLCDRLGRPQDALPAVHIAGTNGKGSAARLAAALLAAAGRRVGLYTSPHLERITERIVVSGAPIDDAEFTALLRRLVPLFARVAGEVSPGPSRFEMLTALALCAFTERGIDAAVMEAGLGGTHDATNVIGAGVAVLTNVGLDHTRYLGSTEEAIAEEKAGIVRPGAITVGGPLAPGPRAVLERRCAQVGATLWRVGAEIVLLDEHATAAGRRLSVRTPGATYRDLQIPFRGAHQAHNAVCALAAAEAFLGAPLPAETVRSAWAGVQNPGRFEIFPGEPTTVVDVAHNAAGAAALHRLLAEHFGGRDVVVLIGVAPGKDTEGILRALRPGVRAVVTTQATDAPGVPAPDLARAARACGYDAVQAVADPQRALQRARELARPGEVLVCTGSHYWIGAVYPRLRGPVVADPLLSDPPPTPCCRPDRPA